MFTKNIKKNFNSNFKKWVIAAIPGRLRVK